MSHEEGFLNAVASQITGADGYDKVVKLGDALTAVASVRADMKEQLDKVAALLSHKLAEREVFALTLIQSLAAGVNADEKERIGMMVKSLLEHGKFDSVPSILGKALSLAPGVSHPAQAAMAKASTIVTSYLQATHAAVAAEADKAKQQHGLDVQSFYQAIASADLVKLKDKSGKPLGEWVITSVKTEFHDFSKKKLFTITAQMPLDPLGDVVSAAASGVKHFAEVKLPPFASASNVDAAPPKPAPAPVVGPSGIPNWVPRFVDGELVVDSSSDQLDNVPKYTAPIGKAGQAKAGGVAGDKFAYAKHGYVGPLLDGHSYSVALYDEAVDDAPKPDADCWLHYEHNESLLTMHVENAGLAIFIEEDTPCPSKAVAELVAEKLAHKIPALMSGKITHGELVEWFHQEVDNLSMANYAGGELAQTGGSITVDTTKPGIIVLHHQMGAPKAHGKADEVKILYAPDGNAYLVATYHDGKQREQHQTSHYVGSEKAAKMAAAGMQVAVSTFLAAAWVNNDLAKQLGWHFSWHFSAQCEKAKEALGKVK